MKCCEFAESQWENAQFCYNNPSVTASPCHLPLHKGGLGAVLILILNRAARIRLFY